MKPISATTRKRLNMQGFVDLSDADLAAIGPWLRLSPALTVIWMAVGLFFGSAKVIWAMLPFSLLGAILPGHPFDVFYNFGIRFLIGAPALPRYHLARRACCLMASLWTGVIGWAFFSGATLLGYILGVLFIGAALLPVTIDFCIPAYLYGLIFGKPVACSTVRPK